MKNNTDYKTITILSEAETCLNKINTFLANLDEKTQEEESSDTILTLRKNISDFHSQEQKTILGVMKTSCLETLKNAEKLTKSHLKQLKYLLKIIYYKPADKDLLDFLINFKIELTQTLLENDKLQNSSNIRALENLVGQSKQTIAMYHSIYLSQDEENPRLEMQKIQMQLIEKNPDLIYSRDHENINIVESRLHKEGNLESTYSKQHQDKNQQLRNTLIHWITTNGIAHFLTTLDIKAMRSDDLIYQREIGLKQTILSKALYARLGNPRTNGSSEKQAAFINNDLAKQIQKVINNYSIAFLEERLSFLLKILQYKRSDENLISFFNDVTTKCSKIINDAQTKTFKVKLIYGFNKLINTNLIKQNNPTTRCINQLEKHYNIIYWDIAYKFIYSSDKNIGGKNLSKIANLLMIDRNLIFSTNHHGLNILETCLRQSKSAIAFVFNSIDIRPLLSESFICKHLNCHNDFTKLTNLLSTPCLSRKINSAWANNKQYLISQLKQSVNKILKNNHYTDKNNMPCIEKFLKEYPKQDTNIKNDKLIILTGLILSKYRLFKTDKDYFFNKLSHKKLDFLAGYFNKKTFLSLIHGHTRPNIKNIPVSSTKILLAWLFKNIDLRESPLKIDIIDLICYNEDIDILNLIKTCNKKQLTISYANQYWIAEALLERTWMLIEHHHCDDISELMLNHTNPNSSVIMPVGLVKLISSHFDVFGYTEDISPPEVEDPFLNHAVLQYNRLFCRFLHYVRCKNLDGIKQLLLSNNGSLLLKSTHKNKKNLLRYLTPKDHFGVNALLLVFSQDTILSQLDHTAFFSKQLTKNARETYYLFKQIVAMQNKLGACEEIVKEYKSSARCFHVLESLTSLAENSDANSSEEVDASYVTDEESIVDYENDEADLTMDCFVIDQNTPTTKTHQSSTVQGSAYQKDNPDRFKQFLKDFPHAITMARKRETTYNECILKIAAKQWMNTRLSNNQLKLFFIVTGDRKRQAKYVNNILEHCNNAGRSNYFEQDQMTWLNSQGEWIHNATTKTINTKADTGQSTENGNQFTIKEDQTFTQRYSDFMRKNSHTFSTGSGLTDLLHSTNSSSSNLSNNPFALSSRASSRNEQPSNNETSSDITTSSGSSLEQVFN
jgi:hypothetical protein